jgi:hypothetical protein
MRELAGDPRFAKALIRSSGTGAKYWEISVFVGGDLDTIGQLAEFGKLRGLEAKLIDGAVRLWFPD